MLWARGDLADARESWRKSLDSLYRAGHKSDMLGGSIALADIQVAQGWLTDAEQTYRRALEISTEAEPPLRGAADMQVGMGELLRERGDLEGSHRHLAAAEALGEYAGLPQNRHRRRMAAARLLMAEGDPASAIPLLDEAERLYTPDFFPDVHPIPALRARAQLRAGRTVDARDWVRRAGVTVDDELTYLREFEHITLARVLLADTEGVAEANGLLERLLRAAEQGEREGSVLEALICSPWASTRRDALKTLLDALRRAIALAEPEGYVGVFADEGPSMARLAAPPSPSVEARAPTSVGSTPRRRGTARRGRRPPSG